jgi:pilus assembly protein Flp/PilA
VAFRFSSFRAIFEATVMPQNRHKKESLLMLNQSFSKQRRKAERGQGLVEYSLIIALVAIVVIAILVLMGPQIGQIFSTITNGL